MHILPVDRCLLEAGSGGREMGEGGQKFKTFRKKATERGGCYQHLRMVARAHAQHPAKYSQPPSPNGNTEEAENPCPGRKECSML